MNKSRSTFKPRSHPSINGCPVCRGPLTGRSIFINTVIVAFTFQIQVNQFHDAIQNVTKPKLSPSLSSPTESTESFSEILNYPQLSSINLNYNQPSSMIVNQAEQQRWRVSPSLSTNNIQNCMNFQIRPQKNTSSRKFVVSAQRYVPLQLI